MQNSSKKSYQESYIWQSGKSQNYYNIITCIGLSIKYYTKPPNLHYKTLEYGVGKYVKTSTNLKKLYQKYSVVQHFILILNNNHVQKCV